MRLVIESEDWRQIEKIATGCIDEDADVEQIAWEALGACAVIAKILLAFKPVREGEKE